MKLVQTISIAFLLTIGLCAENKTEGSMESRLSIITLGVENLKQSADFYENKFGWVRSEMSNEGILFFQLNGTFLSLYNRNKLAEDVTIDSSGNGFKGFTLCYLTRSEAEVDAIIKKMRQAGVKIVKEPQKVFWGGYSSYIADPDGNLWEIAFNPYLIPEEQKTKKD